MNRIRERSQELHGILERVDFSSASDVHELARHLNFLNNEGVYISQSNVKLNVPEMIQTRDELLSGRLSTWSDIFWIGKRMEKIIQNPLGIKSRSASYGHTFSKAPGKISRATNIDYRDGKFNDSGRDDLFLGVMCASMELASRAFNRYDTDLFHFKVTEAEDRDKTLTIDSRGVPIIYPELGRLVAKADDFVADWNRVFMKYVSNLVHDSEFEFRGDVPGKNLQEMCAYVPRFDRVGHELTSLTEGYDSENKDSDHPARLSFDSDISHYVDLLENKARITCEKIDEFSKVISEYDSRMDFAGRNE